MALFYLLISAMPFMQHPLFGAWAGGLTVTKYLGGVCLFYALYRLAEKGRMPRFFATPVTAWFLAFVGIAMLSFTLSGHSQQLAESPFALYFSLALQCFITPIIVDSKQRLRHVLLAQIFSMAFASLYVIKEWYVYRNLYANFRPGAVVGDSNYFGVSVAATLPVSYYLVVRPGPLWQRLGALGSILLTLVAFLLGASRGGLLGLLAAGIFVVLNSPKPVRNLIRMTLVLVPLMVVVPNSPVRRLLHPTFSDEEAVELRSYAWKAGIRMAETHPITGIGLGNFKSMVTSFEDPGEYVVSIGHNTYVELAAELGLPGLLCFVGAQLAALWRLQKIRRAFRRAGESALAETALGLQAGILGSLIALTFVSGQVQKLFWFSLFLSMALDLSVLGGARKRTAPLQQARKQRGNANSLTRRQMAASPNARFLPADTGSPAWQ